MTMSPWLWLWWKHPTSWFRSRNCTFLPKINWWNPIDTGTNERASRKKRSTIANYLRLLKNQWSSRNSWWLYQHGHGRAIINIEDLDIQTDIYQRIVQNLSVRDTESFSKKLSGKSKNRNQKSKHRQHLKFKKLKKGFY
jgi:hypothetical protein